MAILDRRDFAETADAILYARPRFTTIFCPLFALVFFAALTWIVFIPFEQTIHARGDLRVADDALAVHAQQEGRLLTVAAREGAYVEKGAVLFRLDDAPARLDRVAAEIARVRQTIASREPARSRSRPRRRGSRPHRPRYDAQSRDVRARHPSEADRRERRERAPRTGGVIAPGTTRDRSGGRRRAAGARSPAERARRLLRDSASTPSAAPNRE